MLRRIDVTRIIETNSVKMRKGVLAVASRDKGKKLSLKLKLKT